MQCLYAGITACLSLLLHVHSRNADLGVPTAVGEIHNQPDAPAGCTRTPELKKDWLTVAKAG